MRRLFWGAVVAVMVAANGMTAAAATLQEHYAEYNKLVGERQFYLALPHIRLVYKQSKKALGPDHLQTGAMAANLAYIYWATGNVWEAIPAYEEAYRVLSLPANEEAGAGLLNTVISNLANAYLDRGEYRKAEPLFERWLNSSFGKDPSKVADRLAILMDAARNQRQLSIEKAVAYAQEAHDIAAKLHGRRSDEAGRAMTLIGEIYMAHGRYDDARKFLQSAAKKYKPAPQRGAQTAYQDLALIAYLSDDRDDMMEDLGAAKLDTINNLGFSSAEIPGARACPDGLGDVENPWIYVQFVVTDLGDVIQPEVIAANPPLVQDTLYLSTLSAMKYSPLVYRGKTYGRYDQRLIMYCQKGPVEQDDAVNPFSRMTPEDLRFLLDRPNVPDELAEARAAYVDTLLKGNFPATFESIQSALEKLALDDRANSAAGAVLWHDLGVLLLASRGEREAVTPAAQALSIAESVFGKDAPELFPFLLLKAKADADEDEAKQALKLAEKKFGKGSIEAAAAYAEMARSGTITGENDRQREIHDWQQAVDIARANPETPPAFLALLLYHYGNILMGTTGAEFKEAGRKLLTEMIDGPGRYLAPGTRILRAAHYDLQQYYGMAGDMETAMFHAKEANMGDSADLKGLVRPLPVSRVMPEYPRAALMTGIQGHGVFTMTVDKEGHVKDIKTVTSWPPGVFEGASIDAITKLQYVPYFEDGAAIDEDGVQFRMIFELQH